jgi:hypothetical protein
MTENPLRLALSITGIVLLIMGGTLAYIGVASPGILGFGVILMGVGIGALAISRNPSGKPKAKIDQKPTETISDWSVPGILPGSPVPILEHADIAAENAEYAGRLFQLHVMDVGVSVDIPGDADVYVVQSGRVPVTATNLRPFVTVYAGYPQRGTLEMRLFDDQDEEQYNHHEIIDLNNRGAVRSIGEPYTLPSDVAGEWAMAVYFNTTLIALHAVDWETQQSSEIEAEASPLNSQDTA